MWRTTVPEEGPVWSSFFEQPTNAEITKRAHTDTPIANFLPSMSFLPMWRMAKARVTQNAGQLWIFGGGRRLASSFCPSKQPDLAAGIATIGGCGSGGRT